MTRARPQIRDVAQVLSAHDSILLTTHVRPDGDAVGSSLALLLALTRLGKHAVLVTHDDIPTRYAFLPGFGLALRPGDQRTLDDFGLAVALDCDGADRMGDVRELFDAVGRSVDIDHHEGLKAFGDVQAVCPEASSTGELIWELVGELGVALDPQLATCLLCAITYDTGSFRHTNTTPAAHRIAAELIAAGADPHEVSFHVFGNVPHPRLALKGRALAGATLELGGRVALGKLFADDFRATGAQRSDVEGIIDELRSVEGIDVAALVVDMGDGTCKASLRAVSDVDVAVVAAAFGGGGHRRAAGCEVRGNIDAVAESLLAALEPALVSTQNLGA